MNNKIEYLIRDGFGQMDFDKVTDMLKDAHGVYRKVGFNPLYRPDDWMEIRYTRPDR